MIKKIFSRKFLVALATIISGFLMMFGFAESSIEVIAGAIVSLGGALGYMLIEGSIDKKNLNTIVDSATDIVEEVMSNKK